MSPNDELKNNVIKKKNFLRNSNVPKTTVILMPFKICYYIKASNIVNIFKKLASLKNNATKIWPFYNVTSIHNSHVSTISIIQRNSDVIRKQNHLKKWRNCNVIKLRRNSQRKWNAAVTLFQYVMQTYHKKVIQKWGPNTQSNCFVFSYVVGTYQ